MPDNNRIPEEFWQDKEVFENPFEAERLLEVEIDRLEAKIACLETENKQLKEILQQTRVERDTYMIRLNVSQNSNSILVKQYGRR